MIIVFTGMKHCGKSTQARRLARKISCSFTDTDELMSSYFQEAHGQILTAKEIFAQYGAETFKTIEENAIRSLIPQVKKYRQSGHYIISLGGGTSMNVELIRDLKEELGAFVVFLNPTPETLFDRVKRNGPSRFLQGDNPEAAFLEIYKQRLPFYESQADMIVGAVFDSAEEIQGLIYDELKPLLIPSRG